MKNKMAIIILLSLLSLEASAKNKFYCSHAELCKMIQSISRENNLIDLEFESLVLITGDPHEYEPSVIEIKKLIDAPLLVTGPTELNPWIKKINFQRSKIQKIQTFSLLFEQKDYLTYTGANGDILSHFWIYPKIYCSLKNKMESILTGLGYALKSIRECDSKKAELRLSAVLSKIKKPIILTHDALLPLLVNLSKGPEIVAIKGSGHHEEANPESVKKMYNALKAPQVIWIQESGINIPQNIINKIRPQDIVIKIDTAKTKENEAFSVLSELTEKLSPYKEK
jgi:hypothetical protein